MYSYHPAGGVTTKRLQVTRTEYDPNNNYPSVNATANLDVNYTYTWAGQVATMSYPTLPIYNVPLVTPTTFTYSYDGASRPQSMADDGAQGINPPTAWVTGMQYDYAGRLSTWQQYYGTTQDYYGNPVTNTVTETMGYNVNGQLTSFMGNFPGNAPSGTQYLYSATQNNGQMTGTLLAAWGLTTTYQYDALKRLTSATASASQYTAAWAETFQYDGFGNMTGKTLNGSPTATLSVNAATNRLTNAGYDANGNMWSGAGAGLSYDEANRIVAASETSGGTEHYGYAPDNKRIYRLKADGVTEEFTFYGAKGERLGVYELDIAQPQQAWPPKLVFVPLRSTVWFAGRRIWEGGVVVEDRLGTVTWV